MKPPTILCVITRLGVGGPPAHAVLLTREMRRLGYRTLLVTGSCAPGESEMSYLLGPDDEVIRIEEMSRSVSPWRDLVALGKLYRLMRRERPAIVHTHTAKAGLLGRIAARVAGVPAVLHTFHGNVLDRYFPEPVNILLRGVERTLAKLTDGICVLSPEQADELTERYRVAPRKKVHVVPLGMDLAGFARIPPAADPGGKLVVGWLGRLVPVKNVPLLLAVVRRTLERTGRIRFVIAGDGCQREAVEQAAALWGPDRCKFAGWQRDITPVLAECDVLLGTSKNEGTPVALIQGMAAGRPFVATPAGGVVDMAEGPGAEDGRGCRWFGNAVLAVGGAEPLVDALCALEADRGRLQSMAEAARRFSLQNYTLEPLLRRLNRLYLGLLREREASSTHALIRGVGFGGDLPPFSGTESEEAFQGSGDSVLPVTGP